MTIKIFTDGGEVPGSVLYSGVFSTVVSDGEWQGLSGLNWSLTSGTYRVGFEGDGPSFAFADYMPYGAPNQLLNEAVGSSSGYNPGDSLAIGVRIFGQQGGVPEPGAWAHLILGFGAVGGAMRHRTGAGVRARAALRFA